jgi:hypothetical protein
MALKADLQSRESQCKTVEDYVKLAFDALTEPSDADYALELIESAEDDCKFPIDYIKVAEVYAKGLNNKEKAEEMYEEAEDNCFESLEFAQLGHSIACFLDDKDKAKEMLENAAKDGKKVNEFLLISQYVREDLGDEALAKKMLDKVLSQCKTIRDYRNLAENVIKEQKDIEAAKSLYKTGDKLVDEINEAVEYAEGILALFSDKQWVTDVLEGVADDAQFTKDFVILAAAFKNLCNDIDKARELMDSGKDYAMKGDEWIDLANGWWNLFNDGKAASDAYSKALKDISDKNQLLKFAKDIALQMGDKELAKKYYAQAESKMSGAKELTTLAQAILEDLQDKAYASDVFGRAAESINDPKELMSLAGNIIKNLGDKEKGFNIFQKSFEKIEKFPLLFELLSEFAQNLDNKDFMRKILLRAEEMASGTPELLQVSLKIIELLGDKDFASGLLTTAEENVTTLKEMQQVVEAVKLHFADNKEWAIRVDEKFEKRQQNQAKYEELQKRENAAKFLKDYLNLTDDVMTELEDKYYARKLLSKAESLLSGEFFNIDNYKKLIVYIDKYTKDNVWLRKLLDEIFDKRVRFNFDLIKLCEISISSLSDKPMGKELAKKYLLSAEKIIDNSEKKSVYDYSKLAETVISIQDDKDWALNIIAKAESPDCTSLDLARLGFIANMAGNSTRAYELYKKAAMKCSPGQDFLALTAALKDYKAEDSTLREIYKSMKQNSLDSKDLIMWLEGIVNIFGDKSWAKSEYNSFSGSFKTDTEKKLYQESYKQKIDMKYW